MRMRIFASAETAELSGTALRLYLMLAARGGESRMAELEAKDLRHKLRMGRKKMLEALEELRAAGWVHSDVQCGVVLYRLSDKRGIRTFEMSERAAEQLCCMRVCSIRVWFLLNSYTGNDGNCWPGKRTIAKLLGRSIRTVERSIKMLTDLGLYFKHKVPWSKVPNFSWRKTRTVPVHRKKLVTVYQRIAPRGAIVSLSKDEKCRMVRKTLNFEISLCAWQDEKVAISLSDLPPELQSLRLSGEYVAKPNHKMSGFLAKVAGFSSRQSAWIAHQYSERTIALAVRSLLETPRGAVRDTRRYLIGAIRRLALAA